jgi:hypothetical protein
MLTEQDINQIRKCGFQNKPYRADVEIELANVSQVGDGEGALTEYLSELATGFPTMTDVSYRVVDFKGDDASTLIVSVSGRVEQVVADLNAAQQEG